MRKPGKIPLWSQYGSTILNLQSPDVNRAPRPTNLPLGVNSKGAQHYVLLHIFTQAVLRIYMIYDLGPSTRFLNSCVFQMKRLKKRQNPLAPRESM